MTYNQAKVEEYLQNVDPLKQNLVKSYYTLRLLKSRESKAKMIQDKNRMIEQLQHQISSSKDKV